MNSCPQPTTFNAAADAEAHPNLEWYDADAPKVSIVILNYNKPDLTRICLERLWANTTGHRYEIIVVDNGSAPENIAPLRDVPGPMRLLELDVNRYFGEGNNIGAEAARGDYVLFLNNDAFVTPRWLEPLIERLVEEPLIGGVGPRFLYPDGRLQEAGAFITPDGHSVQVGKFSTYAPDDVEKDHVVDYCSAACFLMRRDLFLAIGGFEYVYEPAYYEDVDLCLKIAAKGLFVGYCSRSHVIHVENATSSTHREALGLHNIVEVNRLQFLRIWRDRLRARDDAAMAGSTVATSSPALPARRPRAVFYTPYEITPGGGERYLLTAAAALLRDFDVHLVTEASYSWTRTRAIGRDLNLDLHGLQLSRRRELSTLGQIAFSVVMSNEMMPPFPAFGLRSLYLCQFPFPQNWDEDVRRFGNLDSFAGTVVYSDFVRENLLRLRDAFGIPKHPVEVIAPPVPIAPGGTVPVPFKPPYRFVLIGRFFVGGHNKRHDVGIEMIRHLKAMGYPVELDLVGSLPAHPAHRAHYAHLREQAHGLPIRFHVNATPEELKAVLARGHFYLHGAGYTVDETTRPHECEHFGIGVLEAMSYGLVPFVVANGGPVAFVKDGTSGYTYRTMEDLLERTISAITSPDALPTIRANAIKIASGFAEGAFADRWRARAAELMR